MGFGFLTSKTWSPADVLFGALPFLWGTLYTAVAGMLNLLAIIDAAYRAGHGGGTG